MSSAQVITGNQFVSDGLFFGSPAGSGYLWKNIIIDKRNSINWVGKLFKDSILSAFWSVLSSPIG